MKRFKLGQSVVYIEKTPMWHCTMCKQPMMGPHLDEICTVKEYDVYGDYIVLVEYESANVNHSCGPVRSSYNQNKFRPLITTQELNEALKSEEVTV